MSDKTSIEWTDATWNPIRGCTRVSEGCRNCYAEAVAARFSDPGMPYEGLAKRTPSGPRWTGKVITVPAHLEDPIRWKEPRMIFVNSMSDLFHESLSFADIMRVMDVMKRAPQHVYQILTKRPERMREFFDQWGEGTPPCHWWLGTSVEDEPTARKRIPELLNTRAALRWLSIEPLLAPIGELRHHDEEFGLSFSWLDGFDGGDPPVPGIDWVVVGGESGPAARPMHPDWVRSIRDQCQAWTTPFFFKQWGAWAEVGGGAPHRTHEVGGSHGLPLHTNSCFISRDGHVVTSEKEMRAGVKYRWMSRLGKKKAGRVLDGRTWDEYPASLSHAAEQRIIAEAKC
jgi:protein gp37